MDNLKKHGHHPIVAIFRMVIEVFQSLEKQNMPHVFEKLLMKAFQKYMTALLLWQLKNIWSSSKK